MLNQQEEKYSHMLTTQQGSDQQEIFYNNLTASCVRSHSAGFDMFCLLQ